MFVHFVDGFGVGGGAEREWVDSAVGKFVCFVFLFGRGRAGFADFF